MTQLIAFHGDTKLKAALLAEVAEHRLHDQIIKGTYGEGSNGNWKGCAVGCSLHSLNSLNRKLGTKYKTSDHAAFEPAAGVPVQIAYLQDYIFENLPSPKHIDWPERFWAVIQPGADLTLVTPRFVRWLLEDTLPIVVKRTETKAVYERIIALYDRWIGGNKPSAMEWSEVYSAAAALYDADVACYAAAAADAARYAAAAARYAVAAADAAAARYAVAAADAARYAVAAADAARYAAAAAARYAVAYHAVFEKQADKLIELLSTAPVLSSANQPESADEQYAGGKPK